MFIIERDEIDFKCPITRDYFDEPVFASDGRIYEKKALIEYLKYNNLGLIDQTKIITGYYKNYLFEQELKKFKDSRGLDNFDEEIEKYNLLFKCDEHELFEKICYMRNEKFLRKLMARKKFNANYTNKCGYTHIMFACTNNLEDICLELLNKIEDENLNQLNMHRNTILMLSCNYRMEKLAEKILDRGVKCISQKNDYGNTAYDIAKNKNLNILTKISICMI